MLNTSVRASLTKITMVKAIHRNSLFFMYTGFSALSTFRFFSITTIIFLWFYHPTGVCESSVPNAGGWVCIAEGGWPLHTRVYCCDTQRLYHIKVNPLLLFSQVGCKAIVCPVQFKTQKFCDMLRQICPEIESSSPGNIKSARYSSMVSCHCHWS